MMQPHITPSTASSTIKFSSSSAASSSSLPATTTTTKSLLSLIDGIQEKQRECRLGSYRHQYGASLRGNNKQQVSRSVASVSANAHTAANNMVRNIQLEPIVKQASQVPPVIPPLIRSLRHITTNATTAPNSHHHHSESIKSPNSTHAASSQQQEDTSASFLPNLLSLASHHRHLTETIQHRKETEMRSRLQRELLKWVRERQWDKVVESLREVLKGKDTFGGEIATNRSASLGNAENDKCDHTKDSMIKQRDYVLGLLMEEFELVMQGKDPSQSVGVAQSPQDNHHQQNSQNGDADALLGSQDSSTPHATSGDASSIPSADASTPNHATVLKYVSYIGKLGAPIPQHFFDYLLKQAKQELTQELDAAEQEQREKSKQDSTAVFRNDYTQKIHIIMDFMAGEIEKEESFILQTFGYQQFARFASVMQTLTDEFCDDTIQKMLKERKVTKKFSQIEQWKRKQQNKSSHHRRSLSAGGATDTPRAPSTSDQDTKLISELDQMLEEITIICSKIEMYARFIDKKMMNAFRKYGADHGKSTSGKSRSRSSSSAQQPTPLSAAPPSATFSNAAPLSATTAATTPSSAAMVESASAFFQQNFIQETGMARIKKELSLNYFQMEHYFLELSIGKALSLRQEELYKFQDRHDRHQQDSLAHSYFHSSDDLQRQASSYDSEDSSSETSSNLSSDDEDADIRPKHSSLVNDLFFIIRKSIHRSCNSFSSDTVCKVLNDIHVMLQETVKPQLARPLKRFVKQLSTLSSSASSSSLSSLTGAVRSDTATRFSQGGSSHQTTSSGMLPLSSFITHQQVQYTTAQLHLITLSLNDLCLCSEYIKKLKQEVLQQAHSLFAAPDEENIQHFAAQLLKLSTDYNDTVEQNIHTIVLSSFEQPLAEALYPFTEANYNINDVEFSQNEVNDPFVDQFTQLLEEWIGAFEDYFIQSNYEIFIGEVIKLTVSLLQIAILDGRKPFSQLGGIQFDKDLRSLIRYFGERTEGSVRDKFAELNQIAFILKVNSLGEMLEFWNDSTMQSIWKFKDAERVRKVLSLRKDLDQEQIVRYWAAGGSIPKHLWNPEAALKSQRDEEAIQRPFNADTDVAIVTGANAGIGYETCVMLLKMGTNLIITCRSEKKIQETIKRLQRDCEGAIPRISGVEMELSSLDSVKRASKEILSKLKEHPQQRLALFVQNAGFFTSTPPFYSAEHQFESMFLVNYLSHFLMTQVLMDQILNDDTRVVIVSSRAHARFPSMKIAYDKIQSGENVSPTSAQQYTWYSHSKLAQMLFMRRLHRLFQDRGSKATVYAVHPGVVLTSIKEGFPQWMKFMMETVGRVTAKTPFEGAQTTVYCCIAPENEAPSGEYYSDCAKTKRHALSDDRVAVDELYDRSMEWVKDWL